MLLPLPLLLQDAMFAAALAPPLASPAGQVPQLAPQLAALAPALAYPTGQALLLQTSDLLPLALR